MVAVCLGRCMQPEMLQMQILTGQKRYENGYKYCGICAVWLYTKEIKCPCCHHMLRTRGRGYARKFVEKKRIE